MDRTVRLIAGLLPFLTLPLMAQKAGIGLKAGPQLSYTHSELIETRMVPGGVVGIYVPWGLGPRLELQPEVLLSAMGSGFVANTGEVSTLRSYYLQVPVSAKVFVSNVVNFHAGIEASRVLKAERTVAEERNDFTQRMSSTDFGLIGGLGFDFTNGMDLTLRYLNGMRPVLANDQILFPRNRSFSFTVGYRLKEIRMKAKSRRRR